MTDSIAFPSTEVSTDQHKMLQAISCAVTPKSAIYISGPITTGRYFLEWYQLEGSAMRENRAKYSHAFREKVVSVNERAITLLAEAYRQVQHRPVIEPASLFVPEWTQAQYLRYWTQVLDQFVSEVVLVEGWQFSVGCATEFSFAIGNGLTVLTHDGISISAQAGWALITEAATEIDRIAGADTTLGILATNLRAAVPEEL